MKKFNLLVISNMYPSDKNPSYGIFVKNIEGVLKNNGISVETIVKRWDNNFLSKLKEYFKFYCAIIRKLSNKKGYDIAYLHYFTHTFLPVLLGKLIFRNSKTQIVVHVHGNDIIERGKLGNLLFQIFRNFTHYVNGWVVPSNYFKKVLVKELNIEEKKTKICVYPSGGINLKLFRPLDKIECKKKFGFSEKDFVIGWVANIYKGKGWDVFLKALSILEKKQIQFKALVAGGGSEVPFFKEEIENLKLQDKIRYLGWVEHTNLVEVYNAMDVFTTTTRLAESLNLTNLEAMACGIPVIASKIGGILDYVENDRNGFLYTPGNAEELAKRLIEFYNLSQEEKAKMSNSALKTAQKYDSGKVIQNFINFFEEVLNEDSWNTRRT